MLSLLKILGRSYGVSFGWVVVPVVALAQSPSVPFAIQGSGVVAGQFKMTTFATGLNYPVGMVELPDGSVAVGVSNNATFYGSTSGSILRLWDQDGDGVAESRTTLVADVPGGKISALRKAGNLFFVTGQGGDVPISIYRQGASPADPLTLVGSLSIAYPSNDWSHPHSALSVRQTPGTTNSYDLLFQVGSDANISVTTQTATLSSSIGVSGSLAGDALHAVRITDLGNSITGSHLQQIATGLRNPAGHAFHPVTGDLYFEDNGIDGIVNPIEPTSADELNRIARQEIGGAIEDFGFPHSYVQYRTGTVVGGTGIAPLVAFQPIPAPNGSESEGPNDIAFAPRSFPVALRNGLFVGMHGQFNSGGIANEENPLVYVDLNDNSYFHFVGNNESQVGHLDGLLSTDDSLFVADIGTTGGLFSNATRNTGAIYKIQSLLQASDLNSDGAVDAADAGLLFEQWASSDYVSDLNRDGVIDAADAGILFEEWTGDSRAAVGVVPEPATGGAAALLVIAAFRPLLRRQSSPSPAKQRGRHCW